VLNLPQFPIGFWSYTRFDQIGPEAVQDYVDCGITVAQTPRFRPGIDRPEAMLAFLDACDQAGLRAIVCDDRTYFWTWAQVGGAQGFRRQVEEAVRDFGDHPAVMGFHVGDEPNRTNTQQAFRASAIHKEVAPHLSPFLNLGPYGPGTCEWVGYPDYNDFLADYVRIGKPDYLCFDVYWQLLPEDAGREDYFACLRMYSDAARRYSLPLWITPLAVGHFRYRRPTEDLFRWQVNTAAAHGLTGLCWFFFYMREPHDNYRVPPVDEHWERTETFEWLSRVNRSFLQWHAPLLLELELKNVYHEGQVWGGYPRLADNSRLVHHTEGRLPLIVAEFKDGLGRDIVAVVNNSQENSDQAIIRWRGTPRVVHIRWQGQEEEARAYVRDEADRGKPTDEIMTGLWLAPGQMEMYRLDNRS
jgi:hypothetical protein